VIALAKIAILLLADALRFLILLLRPGRSLIAENLFLRRQLALYKERGVKPRADRFRDAGEPGRAG
jgi:hypothetical protein